MGCSVATDQCSSLFDGEKQRRVESEVRGPLQLQFN